MFFNVFYPENDLSCLTFRTRFLLSKGTFDISCGSSAECRIATFAMNQLTPGKFMLHPYADNADCSQVSSWQKFYIIDGDPDQFLLLYCCYVQGGRKIQGGYLLTRAGVNFTKKYYEKILQPLMLIANKKEFITTSDVANMATASCNCTDYCGYYEIRTECRMDVDVKSDCEFRIENFYHYIGIVAVLMVICIALVMYLFKDQLLLKID